MCPALSVGAAAAAREGALPGAEGAQRCSAPRRDRAAARPPGPHSAARRVPIPPRGPRGAGRPCPAAGGLPLRPRATPPERGPRPDPAARPAPRTRRTGMEDARPGDAHLGPGFLPSVGLLAGGAGWLSSVLCAEDHFRDEIYMVFCKVLNTVDAPGVNDLQGLRWSILDVLSLPPPPPGEFCPHCAQT